MQHLKPIQRPGIVLTIILFGILLTPPASAENAEDTKDPESICRRLPTTPEPDSTSTLRLITAYAMPTIIAQFGSSALETDYISQNLTTNNQTETLRNFMRASQPYHWEISLFWKFSELPNQRNLTPLTEAYRHHEYRLGEAHKICNALRRYPLYILRSTDKYHDNPTQPLDDLLTQIERQRTTALLRIYVPKTIISPQFDTTDSTFSIGALP